MNVSHRHINRRANKFTLEMISAKYERWPDKPYNTNHVQVLEWIQDHIPYLDARFNYKP